MSMVPSSMSEVFKAAGWFDGRRVAVPTAVPMTHPAHAVLAEFGGLILMNPAPNICSIAFRHVSTGASEMRAWEAALGTDMIGIAEEDDGHATLYLSDRGQVIGCSEMHPAYFLVGQNFNEALEAIGTGKRAQPMLLPDDREITLYGVTFRQGDKGVLGPTELT